MLQFNQIPKEWGKKYEAMVSLKEEAKVAMEAARLRAKDELAEKLALIQEQRELKANEELAAKARAIAKRSAKALKKAKAEKKAKTELFRLAAKRTARAHRKAKEAGQAAFEARAKVRAELNALPPGSKSASKKRGELSRLETPAEAYKRVYANVVANRNSGCPKQVKQLKKTIKKIVPKLETLKFLGLVPSFDELTELSAPELKAFKAFGFSYALKGSDKFRCESKTVGTIDGLLMGIPIPAIRAAIPSHADRQRDNKWVKCTIEKNLNTLNELFDKYPQLLEYSKSKKSINELESLLKDKNNRSAHEFEGILSNVTNQIKWAGEVISRYNEISENHARKAADWKKNNPVGSITLKEIWILLEAFGFVPKLNWDKLIHLAYEADIDNRRIPFFRALTKTKRWAWLIEEFKGNNSEFNYGSELDTIKGLLVLAAIGPKIFEMILNAEMGDYSILSKKSEIFGAVHTTYLSHRVQKPLPDEWVNFARRALESELKVHGNGARGHAIFSVVVLMSKIAESQEKMERNGITHKISVKAMKAFLDSSIYNGTHQALMTEAAKWKVHEDAYPEIEKQWLKGLKTPKSEMIEKLMKVETKNGARKVFMLPHEDVRGIFLGHHTECCQHPEGVGSDAAWYGHENPNSGFVVLEDSGTIIAQGLVWETDKPGVICFDNIEAKGNTDRMIKLIPYFQEWCEAAGISATMGTGYMEEESFAGLKSVAPLAPKDGWGGLGYTDAKKQVKLM